MSSESKHILISGGGLGIEFAQKLCKRLQDKGIIKSAVVVVNDSEDNTRGIIGDTPHNKLNKLFEEFSEPLILCEDIEVMNNLLRKNNSYHQIKKENRFLNKSRRIKNTKKRGKGRG